MAIGAFVESGGGGGGGGGGGYGGRVTAYVVLTCVVAGSGGILFGYDLVISGSCRFRRRRRLARLITSSL